MTLAVSAMITYRYHTTVQILSIVSLLLLYDLSELLGETRHRFVKFLPLEGCVW